MWTYLVIFLSILCLLIVFARRLYLALIKKPREKLSEEDGKKPSENDSPEDKKRVSKEDKSEMERLYKRAVAQIKRKEPKEAVKTLVQALAIDHDYLDAQVELGKLYLDQKMWGKASAVYKSLSERTKDPVDYSHLGLALYNAGELDEAIEAYQAAISLDPKRSQRYLSLGQIYRDLEKNQLALIAFNKALDLDKENVDYLLVTADTHIQLENFDDATSLLNKAIEVAPMSKIARKMLKEVEVARKALEKEVVN